jgi:hypothetical protein
MKKQVMGRDILREIRERVKTSAGDFAVCSTNGQSNKPFGIMVGASLKGGAMHLLGDPSRGFEGAEGVLITLTFDRDKLRALRDDCNELLGDKEDL